MVKVRWKAFMEVDFKTPRMSNPVMCLLCSIDFDAETVSLQDMATEREPFYTSLKNISIPVKQPKTKLNTVK